MVQTGLQCAINTRTAALKAINKLFGGRADDAGSLAERIFDALQLLPARFGAASERGSGRVELNHEGDGPLRRLGYCRKTNYTTAQTDPSSGERGFARK